MICQHMWCLHVFTLLEGDPLDTVDNKTTTFQAIEELSQFTMLAAAPIL